MQLFVTGLLCPPLLAQEKNLFVLSRRSRESFIPGWFIPRTGEDAKTFEVSFAYK